MYRSRTGHYTLAGLVTATTGTLWPEGIERGDVPALSSPEHVHLMVMSPGEAGHFPERDVPFAGASPVVGRTSGDPGVWMPPRSWAWPPIIERATA